MNSVSRYEVWISVYAVHQPTGTYPDETYIMDTKYPSRCALKTSKRSDAAKFYNAASAQTVASLLKKGVKRAARRVSKGR